MKKIILLLSMFIMLFTYVGCGTSKPPEGIDKEVWEDSLEVIKILNTIYEEERLLKRKDEIETYNKYVEFYENNNTLTEEEFELVDNILGFKTYWEAYLKTKNKENIIEGFSEDQLNKALNCYNKIKEIIK